MRRERALTGSDALITHLPTRRVTRLAGLTDQERRILELIGEGLTNRQIGERMFLAEKTVKNYVSNLLSKLGMNRRSEAAAYAARLDERKGRRNT